MKRPASAIWCVDKPVGATSSSLVDAFRDEYSGPWPLKVSHGGVLDPFAHGLVLLLVGAANRLFEALHEAPKTYLATVQLALARPFNAIALALFSIALFWHAKLGIQVVIEDYVHARALEVTLQLVVTFACAFGALASLYAIARIALLA